MSLDDLSLPELVELAKEVLEQIEYRAMEVSGNDN